jgi:hypothetical protein
MKKTILTFVLLAMALCVGAQEKTAGNGWKREGKTFVQSAQSSQMMKGDTLTAYKWRDKDGKEYPIILHRYTKGEKAGRTTAYVIRKSAKTGNEYRYFLPDGEKIATEIINETK